MAKRVLAGATVGGCVAAAVLLVTAQAGKAQLPTIDLPAAYLVFPKVVVHTDGGAGTPQTDTLIQITNLSQGLRIVHCFYVDGETWVATNFSFELTGPSTDGAVGQPIAWRVSEGLNVPAPGAGLIPSRGPDFVGELKCVLSNNLVSPVPVNSNDLKGEATIYTVTNGPAGSVDARAYNAIGFEVINVSPDEPPTAQSKRCVTGTDLGNTCADDTNCGGGGTCGVVMCLGANTASDSCPSANYVACPSTLILNNFFDGASDPVTGKAITTDLTLVPCTEDLTQDGPENQPVTAVQFLLFNEFEQRMSTATRLQCFRETQLSQIDTKPGSEMASVFYVGVQGTLVGQTRIRGVTTSETEVGHGLLGLAEEWHGSASVAMELNQTGTNANKADVVKYVNIAE